jgi:hypothetical protein
VDCITFLLAEGVDASTGVNKTNELIVPYAGNVVRATAYAKVAPTGAALIFDVNVEGTSIWSATQANRVQIAAAANEATPQTSFDNPDFAQDENVTIDIDQVGSSEPGEDITVQLWIVPDFDYYGDPDTNGTFRVGMVAGEWCIQKRIAGTYATRQKWS